MDRISLAAHRYKGHATAGMACRAVQQAVAARHGGSISRKCLSMTTPVEAACKICRHHARSTTGV
jgi:hypothetical protein